MKTYAQYYKECKLAYLPHKIPNKHKCDLYKLGINIYNPHQDNELFTFPCQYKDIIESLEEKVDKKANNPQEHYFESGQPSQPFAIKIANIWDLPELEQLAAHFIPELEKTVFKSHAFVSAVHIYRNLQTQAERKSSWLWHYDNNPQEAVKLLIYLTDVTETTGPFEYLRHKKTGNVIKMPTSRIDDNHWESPPPMFPSSRIPATIIDYLLEQGYEKHKVIGQKGTVIFFDNNCIHRANVPSEKYRDVLIFNIRPVLSPIRPFINKEYTGSWMHQDPVRNPEQLRPLFRVQGKSKKSQPILSEKVKNRKIFIDCGGHKATSVQFFKQVYPKAKKYEIYSFEANPNFSIYFDKFKDITYHNVAVWIENGEVEFYNNNGGSSSLIKGKARRGGFEKNKMTVPCIDLSQWIKENFSQEDYIILKLDIEGAEYEVLNKMLRDNTIEYVNKLYIEWHCAKTSGDIPIERHLQTIKDILDKGLIPYKWSAAEAMVEAQNGDYSRFRPKELSRVAIKGREKGIISSHLEKEYAEILDKAQRLLQTTQEFM